jgi:hypothetical protein
VRTAWWLLGRLANRERESGEPANADCSFYGSEHLGIRPSDSGRGREPAAFVSPGTVEWCEHPKHSPWDRERASRPSLGRNLTCGGERSKCPLTPEQYQDVEG